MEGRPQFTFGPVCSRRLGMSLGINLLGDKKKCTFNCVYCEIGRSKADEIVSVEYRYDPGLDEDALMARFKEEVRLPLKNLPEIDSATVGYMGETTLAAGLDTYLLALQEIKKTINRPDGGPKISIFTNSTTLQDPAVVATLGKFDLVMAKLDCATEDLFKKVNRPHASVPRVGEIIKNITILRERMEKSSPRNLLAIQTLLFKSLNKYTPTNTAKDHLEALADAYLAIRPDVVQVYSVAREPAEKGIHALSLGDKANLRAFFERRLANTGILVKVY